MQNITRTFTEYDVKAYDLVENDGGEPAISVIAECRCLNTSMTKSTARAELAQATGAKLPKGVTIKWKPIETVTYAMPMDKFIEYAIIISKEEVRG